MTSLNSEFRTGGTLARAALLLVAAQLAACSTATQPARHPDNLFLQAFEATQLPPEEGKEGSWELILVLRDDEGQSHVYRSGAEGMDRLVYVWGEKGPAVPIFFSPEGAMGFTIYQSWALSEDPNASAAAIDERAWQKYLGAEKRLSEKKDQQ